jgi:hypothetical protein
MITKLKWQWQSSTSDLAQMTTNFTQTQTQPPNPHTGRVITGMLTGPGGDYQSPRGSGKGTPSNGGGF